MADDDESDEPAVVLGEKTPVEGVPLARISARLMWGIEQSEIKKREGETHVRTPDGPRALGDILAETDKTYFSTRQEFETAIRKVIGQGPVPTAEADNTETSETQAEAGEAENEDEA